MREKARVMDADAMRRALTRMAHEILERNKTARGLAIIGIHTRGVPLANRLAKAVSDIEQTHLDLGTLDVSRYRDDRPDAAPPAGRPAVGGAAPAFRVPLYPLVPAAFLAMCAFMLWSAVDYIRNPTYGPKFGLMVLAGLVVMALGIPLYFLARRK